MTTARDLVNTIQSGKSATIQATFDSLMTEKIQEGIESYRQAVIDNTFNPELVFESTEEEIVEDADDSSISEEFDLSEYTLEEIQEFMESEDFATLDELSQNTLKSYINKAREDGKYNSKLSSNAHRASQTVKFKSRSDKDAMIDRAEKYGFKADKRSAGEKNAKDRLHTYKESEEEVSDRLAKD
jgi:hypothetical protein